MPDFAITIGRKDKHDAFVERHREFFARYPSLKTAETAAFDRTLASTGNLDPIIFYLGIRCADDFVAITLLAAHDLGLAATALVRGMYERVVTAVYLHNHPDEVQEFADFDIVQTNRLIKSITKAIGIPAGLEEAFARNAEEYERVKSRYEVTVCKACDTTRVGPTWSKLDFVSMASTLPNLGDLLPFAYYLPLSQAHSTLKSITALLEETGGQPTFRADHTKESDEAFRTAHLLLMHVLQLQADHFGTPEIKAAVDHALQDYLEIWPGRHTAREAGA